MLAQTCDSIFGNTLRLAHVGLVGVGKKLKVARLALPDPKHRSQEAFAELLGITRASLAAYEVERNRVPDDVLKSAVKVTGFSLKWFLDGTDSPIPGISSAISLDNKTVEDMVELLYLGEVPCGDWSMPNPDGSTILVPADVLRHSRLKGADKGNDLGVVTVRGDSMYPRFRDGQKITILLTKEYVDGFIYVVENQDHEVTLKVVRKIKGEWHFRAINEDHEESTAEQVTCVGRAIRLVEDADFGLKP